MTANILIRKLETLDQIYTGISEEDIGGDMVNITFRGKNERGTIIEGSLLSVNRQYYIYPNNFADFDDIDFGHAFVEVSSYGLQVLKAIDASGIEIWEDIDQCMDL